MTVDVLTVSSKGQIVLPAPIRNALSIAAGDKLTAYASDGAILLKPLKMPAKSEFQAWMEEMQAYAAEVGLTESDIEQAISEVRAERRA